jgi:hypothetical protein
MIIKVKIAEDVTCSGACEVLSITLAESGHVPVYSEGIVAYKRETGSLELDVERVLKLKDLRTLLGLAANSSGSLSVEVVER